MAAPSKIPRRALVEVTNTVRVPYITGIQRIVRHVLACWPDDPAVELVPVVHTGRRFRLLEPHERAALDGEPSGPPPDTGIRGGWRTVARKVPGARATRDQLVRWRDLAAERGQRELWVEPVRGDLLFELEATWWSPMPRRRLLPALAAKGVDVATVVYDLMPLRNPEWFDPENRERFTDWAGAQFASADLILSYSDFNLAEVRHFGGTGAPRIARFVPGADGTAVRAGTPAVRPAAIESDRPFALSVSTIEPRKNTVLLLDAFERLWAAGEDVGLVLVGRKGWDVDELVRRLDRHPERGRRLHWLGWCSDAELDWLYDHAHVVAVPSWCEGYGLPVVEAEARGARVLSSTGGALPEVGGRRTSYLAPDDLESWTAGLGSLLRGEESTLRPAATGSGAVAATTTWADAAAQIHDHLADLGVTGR